MATYILKIKGEEALKIAVEDYAALKEDLRAAQSNGGDTLVDVAGHMIRVCKIDAITKPGNGETP